MNSIDQRIARLQSPPARRHPPFEIAVSMRFKGTVARKIFEEASRRNVTPEHLVNSVIEMVVADNLWAAVLDT